MEIKVRELDHLGILAGIVGEIGLVEEIDHQIPRRPQQIVSSGQAVKAIVLNGLGVITSPSVNTPLKKPTERLTEIEVTDPMHALFGRSFALHSISTTPRAVGYAEVIYQEHMRLRIRLTSTQLAPSCNYLGTKLTLDSVTELVTFVHQCDGLCLFLPISSGVAYHQP